MSDSDLSDAPSIALPSDRELESALRKQVQDALNAGKHGEITLALMRSHAEERLGLEPGFYKRSERWKNESKRIVQEAFEEDETDPRSPPKSKPKPKSEFRKEQASSSRPANSRKRTSPSSDDETAKKRRRPGKSVSSREVNSPAPGQPGNEIGGRSDSSTEGPKQSKQLKKQGKSASGEIPPNPDSDATVAEVSKAENTTAGDSAIDTSESELSVLIDEKPKSKKKAPSAPPAKRRPKSSSSNPKAGNDLDPDQGEIKRLQSWLVKCGVRKLWGKELKPYEGSKMKIRHLKEMLAEVGLTGRYSLEKATQIREERELKADIAAVQEGAERWGKEPEVHANVTDSTTKPKRTLARGPPVLDFLSSDGAETD